MPEITLEVLSLDAVPLPERHCLFTGLGGTIGRDEGNTLVLQDKHRRVSRLHASITFPEGLPTIANASTSLPVTVGSTVLAYGQKMQLSGGDLIEIGPFLLRVRPPAASEVDDALQAHMQPTILAAAIHRPATPKPPVVPMEPVQPIVLGADPFADLFADMTPAVPATSAPSEPEIRHEPTLRPEVFQHPPGSTATSIEPDPFADLLGLGGPPAGGNLPSTAPVGGDPFAAYSQRVEPVAAAYHPVEPPPERTPLAIIPEDFNPFELPSQTSRNAADPLAQMLGGESAQSASSVIANEPSIDALFAPALARPVQPIQRRASMASLCRQTAVIPCCCLARQLSLPRCRCDLPCAMILQKSAAPTSRRAHLFLTPPVPIGSSSQHDQWQGRFSQAQDWVPVLMRLRWRF